MIFDRQLKAAFRRNLEPEELPRALYLAIRMSQCALLNVFVLFIGQAFGTTGDVSEIFGQLGQMQ